MRWPVFLIAFLYAFGTTGIPNGPVHEGQEVDCDLPTPLRVHNTGGIDGQGLCVWASTQMAANYQNCQQLRDLFAYMRTQRGGGWPSRVDKIMQTRAPGVLYSQFVGNAQDGVEFIRKGIDSGRPVMVTYGYGELYNNRTIAHMVLCVGMTDKYTAILDNNDEQRIWWMDTDEFARRFAWPRGQGWAWYLVSNPPPPPPPHN